MPQGARIVLLAVALALMGAASAAAQSDAALLRDGLFIRDRNVAVVDRPKPEYQPLPVRVGAFVFDPQIAAALAYDDNIYATRGDQTADVIAHLQPGIGVVSDWPRHQVSAFARADRAAYFDHAAEDATDYALGAAARLDASRDEGFAGGVRLERDTEPRSAEAAPPSAVRPIRYDVADGWIEAAQGFDRLRLTARGSIDDYAYDNAQSRSGFELYQRDQDHTTSTATLEAAYASLPGAAVLASFIANRRQYRDALAGEAARTSAGYEATLGLKFDLTHLARGDVHVGYIEQDFDSRRFSKIGGAAMRGKIEYFPTTLTTVTLSGSRKVEDSGLIGVGGFMANVAAARVDHELRRNVVLTALLSYAQNDYRNYGRRDEIGRAEVHATYLMNRVVSLSFSYVHLKQGSRGVDAGPIYDTDRVTASLTYRL